MTKIDQIQNQILEKMTETLSNEQLQKLENVMAVLRKLEAVIVWLSFVRVAPSGMEASIWFA